MVGGDDEFPKSPGEHDSARRHGATRYRHMEELPADFCDGIGHSVGMPKPAGLAAASGVPMLNHDGSVMLDHRGRVVYRSQFLSTHPLRSECKERVGYAGRKFTYVSGEGVIRTMNAAFGIGGWGSEITSKELVTNEKDSQGRWCIGYLATVRVTLKGGVSHEDCGSGEGINNNKTHAHEKALKSAITDALKRSARHFGERLGNALYVKSNSIKTAPIDNRSALMQVEAKDALNLFGEQDKLRERFDKDKNGETIGTAEETKVTHDEHRPCAGRNQNHSSSAVSAEKASTSGGVAVSAGGPLITDRVITGGKHVSTDRTAAASLGEYRGCEGNGYNSCAITPQPGDEQDDGQRESNVFIEEQNRSTRAVIENFEKDPSGCYRRSGSSPLPSFQNVTPNVWSANHRKGGNLDSVNDASPSFQGMVVLQSGTRYPVYPHSLLGSNPPPTPCYNPLRTSDQRGAALAETESRRGNAKRPSSFESEATRKKENKGSNPYQRR